MKRSEYVEAVKQQAKVPGAWFVVPCGAISKLPAGVHSADELAERMADLQEAAGVTWDPEEEPVPVPDSLILFGGEILPGWTNIGGESATIGSWSYPPERYRTAALQEAVRRYNEFRKLEIAYRLCLDYRERAERRAEEAERKLAEIAREVGLWLEIISKPTTADKVLIARIRDLTT
jgi:hypothetical protein